MRQYEVDTWSIIRYCWSKQHRVVVPTMQVSDRSMTHHILTDDTVLDANSFGVLEPVDSSCIDSITDIDIVLCPLLAYDGRGHRLGYGHGYYDRFLPQCGVQCFKVGLSWFEPLNGVLPVCKNDSPMTHCITPQRIYRF